MSNKTKKENSVGMFLLDKYGENGIEQYWSDKNTLDPFTVSKGTDTLKVWIKCQKKDYHTDYDVTPYNFTRINARCPYCNRNSGKLHKEDSFGQWMEDNGYYLNDYWNYDKNEIDPYELNKCSDKIKVWINCQNDIFHNSYDLTPNNFYNGRRCPRCNESKSERKICEILRLLDVDYIREYSYKNLVGVSGNNLRYDFYLPKFNILIEYDGEFHYKNIYNNGAYEVTQHHDNLKNVFAISNKIKLIRIPFWEKKKLEPIIKTMILDSKIIGDAYIVV